MYPCILNGQKTIHPDTPGLLSNLFIFSLMQTSRRAAFPPCNKRNLQTPKPHTPYLSVDVAVAGVAQTRVLGQVGLVGQYLLAPGVGFHLGQVHGRVEAAELAAAVAAVVGAQPARVYRERGGLLRDDQGLAVLQGRLVVVLVWRAQGERKKMREFFFVLADDGTEAEES